MFGGIRFDKIFACYRLMQRLKQAQVQRKYVGVGIWPSLISKDKEQVVICNAVESIECVCDHLGTCASHFPYIAK